MGNKSSNPCHLEAAHSATEGTSSTATHVDALAVIEESIRNLPHRLQLSCTRSRERPVCQLLGHLEACNYVLWHLGLQLREDETDDLGDLRLVVSSTLTTSWIQESARLATQLLMLLFTQHRCLVYVELSEDVIRNPFLRQSLASSPGVRKMHVCCYDSNASKVDSIDDLVFQLIPSIERIEELVFRPKGIRTPCGVTTDIFGLKRPDTRLTTIDIAELKMNEPTATRFIARLIINKTVTSLAVGHEIFSLPRFAKYLTKNNPTIRSLALRSRRICDPAIIKNLVSAISIMRTLKELTIAINFTSPQEIAVFAKVVARNRSLRSMSLTRPSTSSEQVLPDYSYCPTASLPEKVEAWLPALKVNCVLKSLTIDFLSFQKSDCQSFFRALAGNKNLMKVTVLNLPTQSDLKETCATIRRCGLEHRVLIKSIRLDSTTIPMLADCPEVTAVSLSTFSRDVDLPNALSVFTSCGHISSVCLDMDGTFFDSASHRSLVAFIEGAVNLRELCLRLHTRFSAEMHLGHRVAQSTVVKAISSNTNFTTVTLIGFHLPGSDCRMLAEAAVRGPCLYHLEIDCHKGNLHFLQHLARAITGSYYLLHVQVPYCDEIDAEHFAVQEITRRNACLVIRAARFVMGDMTSYCVRALEFVWRHPKLIEMVENRAAVSCGEAKKMIKRALSSIAGMDGFMKAAGVIRDRVECYGSPDGQRQLDELDDDCWSHVRKYLTVADVLDPTQ